MDIKNKEIKMSQLKNKNSKKCLSILRQFINEVPSNGEEREVAILALNQLQKVTAGLSAPELSASSKNRLCIGRPLADGSM